MQPLAISQADGNWDKAKGAFSSVVGPSPPP